MELWDLDFIFFIFLCLLVVGLGLFVITTICLEIEKTSQYETEEYIVQAGDTFWGIYLDRYSEDISYQEALYNFKKDNQMTKYELYEGQVVKLRK